MFEYLEKRKVYLVYVPLIIYWIILFTATSLPAANLPSVAISDKIKHFGAFLGLSVLLSLTLLYQNKNLLFKNYHLIEIFPNNSIPPTFSASIIPAL